MHQELKPAANNALSGYAISLIGVLASAFYWLNLLTSVQPGTYHSWYQQSMAASILMLHIVFLAIIILIGATHIGLVSIAVIKSFRGATVTSTRK